jgi:hypothetical protein
MSGMNRVQSGSSIQLVVVVARHGERGFRDADNRSPILQN